MFAYKTLNIIDNEMLLLKIPKKFKGRNVEIIILDTTDSNEPDIVENSEEIETFYDSYSILKDDNKLGTICQEPNEFQKLLLASPTWSDSDFQNFLDNRKLFNQ